MCVVQLGEVAALRREIDRQKDLVETQEVKTKWAQNKLKAEVEAHKVTHNSNFILLVYTLAS